MTNRRRQQTTSSYSSKDYDDNALTNNNENDHHHRSIGRCCSAKMENGCSIMKSRSTQNVFDGDDDGDEDNDYENQLMMAAMLNNNKKNTKASSSSLSSPLLFSVIYDRPMDQSIVPNRKIGKNLMKFKETNQQKFLNTENSFEEKLNAQSSSSSSSQTNPTVAKSKLKRMLMFGGGSSSANIETRSLRQRFQLVESHGINLKNNRIICDTLCKDSSAKKISKSSCDIINTSRKAKNDSMIFLNSSYSDDGSISDEKNEEQLLDTTTKSSPNWRYHKNSKPIRVIKPQPLRPLPTFQRSRPSTSVGFQSFNDFHFHEDRASSSLVIDHLSAFQQVANQVNFHQRSSSLTEPLRSSSVMSKRSDDDDGVNSSPFMMISSFQDVIGASLNQVSNDELVNSNCCWDSTHEPIHMTLEEVRRIAFGSPERFVRKKDINQMKSISSATFSNPINSDVSKTTNRTTSSSSSNAKAWKLAKALLDNLLNKTHCIASNSSNYSIHSNFDHEESSTAMINSQDKQYGLGYIEGRLTDDSTDDDDCDQITTDLKRKNNNKSSLMINFRDLLPHLLHLDGTTSSMANNKQNDSKTNRRIDANNNSQQQNQPVTVPIQSNQNDPIPILPPPLPLTSPFSPFVRRALPPIPPESASGLRSLEHHRKQKHFEHHDNFSSHHNYFRHHHNYRQLLSSMADDERQKYLDYVSSIERVKNCGWYWGPISGEMAEKLLEHEPCGSFLVRDSSDEHYIFSLSFKLDGLVRHVRIEQEQGNFSFGSLKKFRCSTIVDFIESAMEHSRSGQFLFFLHLGPEMGPIRVQLLHPVSRFKRVQSLQHICRFVILQYVRRDQILELPVPKYMHRYLDTPYYYSEELFKMHDATNLDAGNEDNAIKQQQKNRDNKFNLLSKMLIDCEVIERNLNLKLSDFSASEFTVETNECDNVTRRSTPPNEDDDDLL